MHSSIDYLTYVKQNPNVKLSKMRKEKGYNSFGYLILSTFISITIIHHLMGIDINHQTSNTCIQALTLLFHDYLFDDSEKNDFLVVLCQLTKQADPKRSVDFDKNFKFTNNFEPKQIGLEKSLNVLVELILFVYPCANHFYF